LDDNSTLSGHSQQMLQRGGTEWHERGGVFGVARMSLEKDSFKWQIGD
jgi:hypothetical protein